MSAYDKQYGHVAGAPQPPRSWGFVPSSMGSTMVPSSGGGFGGSNYPSTAEFTEAREVFVDPKEAAAMELKTMKRKERRKKRNVEDAHTAAQMLLGCAFVSVIFWAIPCFGTGWHKKMFYGFGIDMVTIRTGLFAIDVVVDCHVMQWPTGKLTEIMHKLDVEQQICKVFQTMNGTHSMNAAKDLACVMGHEPCNIMGNIFYAGCALFFAFLCSALLDLAAFMFLYYYWHIEHLKSIRTWAMALFAIAPCFGSIGYIMYIILSPNIGDLPRSWCAFANTFNAGTGLFTIKPIEGQDNLFHSYGWCFYFAFISCSTSLTGPIVWGIWFKKHPDEKEHELNASLELAELEDAIEATHRQEDEVRMNPALAFPYSGYAGSAHQVPFAGAPGSAHAFPGFGGGGGAFGDGSAYQVPLAGAPGIAYGNYAAPGFGGGGGSAYAGAGWGGGGNAFAGAGFGTGPAYNMQR